MVFENILVEKYHVTVLFPWNSQRAADVLNGFDYNAGSISKTQLSSRSLWHGSVTGSKMHAVQAQAETRVSKLLSTSTENHRMGIIS